MFLPHFLFAFIRLKQGKKKKYDKMPHNRFLSVQWISLGIFQVRNTTFRLYFSFSSLSYLWTVSQLFLRPSLAQIRIIAQIIFKTASFSQQGHTIMATAVKISQFQFPPISLSSAIRVSIMDISKFDQSQSAQLLLWALATLHKRTLSMNHFLLGMHLLGSLLLRFQN